MNLFYIKNNIFNCLVLISSNKKANTKEINHNYFFYDENNNLVGFNIFDTKYFNHLQPGRIVVNQKLLDQLNNNFNLSLKLSDFVYFRVVEILDFEPIVNTHLSKCNVRVDNEKTLQIVCGAKNVKKGLITVLAPINIIMDSSLIIKPSKLQNVESFGMLCSQKELNLQNFNATGIIELNPDKYHVGDIFLEPYKVINE